MPEQIVDYSDFSKKAKKIKSRVWILFFLYLPYMAIVMQFTKFELNRVMFFFAYGALFALVYLDMYKLICPKCGKSFFKKEGLFGSSRPYANDCSNCGLKL